ncbi:type V toxin-antitoxin system endoribonuclease antitoxin GhoS [Enterobacter sp. Cy-643]|uniref:type V toxin-antitoxin system endoribonuclease antitoxin GhoS n=1 Tax=Enterobacter sp. Cy-643 TaxID=2608346 RepID=UPI0014200071|nr:type V toxin-antitoxin system endoribonuclease antitoxin GhoS [Enterobacter sp. Cy-643]NIF32162.1 type V toxin-antitoxin system endoribonuclease antitoxin GhoS [Enterobacter sp. Cy-643]
MSDVERYVITVQFEEQSLTDINELNNQLTRGGFTLTLADDKGKIHELGPGSFGLISALDVQEVEALAKGLGSVALGTEPDVVVTRWEIWQKQK